MVKSTVEVVFAQDNVGFNVSWVDAMLFNSFWVSIPDFGVTESYDDINLPLTNRLRFTNFRVCHIRSQVKSFLLLKYSSC